MSLNDIEALRKEYPEFFGTSVTPGNIIMCLLFFTLPFLIPYLYIRFFESRAASFIRNRLVPFAMFRLHLERLIVLIRSILEFQIIRSPKAKL